MAITPADTPPDPGAYAAVTPHGQGPAPYDIQAPMSDGEIGSAFDAANAVASPGGPRQAQTEHLLSSPQGFASGGYDIDAGTTAGWPADVEPDVAGP